MGSLTTQDTNVLLTGVPHTPMDQLDALLTSAHKRSANYGRHVQIASGELHAWTARLGLETPNQLYEVAWQAHQDGFVKITANAPNLTGVTLLSPGYARVRELNRPAVSTQCFVAMASTTGKSPAFKAGIYPALVEGGWTPYRLEDEYFPDKIDDVILREIRRSGLMVADVTDDRPNVFFEAGLAMGLGLQVIWTVHEDRKDNLHFDTRQYPHIVWTDAANLRDQLSARLGALGLTRS